MNTGRTITLLIVGAFAGAAAMVGTATAAQAATNPCGSSYALVDTYAIPASGPRKGNVELYWSGSERGNCAVTNVEGADRGALNYVGVSIGRSNTGFNDNADQGNYKYYAGPVKTKAGVAAGCLDIHANVNSAKRDLYRVHC